MGRPEKNHLTAHAARGRFPAVLNARQCAICKRPGGTPVSWALRGLGYDDRKNAYAHPNCIAKAKEAKKS